MKNIDAAKIKANSGDTQACIFLATSYENGINVEKSVDEAYKWYKKGSDAGDSFCQYNLGRYYEYGLSVEKNLEKAYSYYAKAMSQNSQAALQRIAYFYENGFAVSKNLVKAYGLWEKDAKENDNPWSQIHISIMLRAGVGIDKNIEKSRYWLERAIDNFNKAEWPVFDRCTASAKEGYIPAMELLSIIYSDGLFGVEKNDSEARLWGKKAGIKQISA